MTDTQFYIFFAALALFPLAQFFWFRATKPLRTRLLTKEAQVLASGSWDEEEEAQLKRFTSYGCGWVFMATCTFVAAPFLLHAILTKLLGIPVNKSNTLFQKLGETKDGKEYFELHTKCMFSSNPIFAGLLLVQLIPLSLLLLLVSRRWDTARDGFENEVVGAVAESRRFSAVA